MASAGLALADATLFPQANSWYLGANIPASCGDTGLAGGLPAYMAKCRKAPSEATKDS